MTIQKRLFRLFGFRNSKTASNKRCTQKMKTIPVVLMGCGGVGRQLLHHIVSSRSLHAKLVILFIHPPFSNFTPFFSKWVFFSIVKILYFLCAESWADMFGWNWQGVHLRVVGVCDSKSSIVVSDVLSMEFDDKFLLELCQLKSNGSSLLTLSTTSGNSITIYIYIFAFTY